MKRFTLLLATLLLACATHAVHAADDNIDVNRLTNSLDQLARDPTLGKYAQAEQALARNAVAGLAEAGSRERPHALYLAERRVDLARAAAQLQDAQARITELDREHDQIMLESSRRDAEAARLELERQRLQYQMAQEETARLQQQGMAASQAAEQAKAEAERARKLAAAQSRVAHAAKREAALAAAAARALRAQMQADADKTPPKSVKPAKSHEKSQKKPAASSGHR